MPKLPEQRLNQPFQRIPLAATTTGLSQSFLRAGCRNGTLPYVKSGNTYLINIPALLRQLGATGGDAD